MQIGNEDFQFLSGLVEAARQPFPPDWRPWFLRGFDQILGLLPPERAVALALTMPKNMPLLETAGGFVWHAESFTAAERSRVLQTIAQDLSQRGQLRGWRNETFACWGWLENDWPYTATELFRVERAAFRYFGLRSHAAHVHGMSPGGRMWCGRRSFNKATDPGLLDNLAAGGLSAGENPEQCAVREIFEEAGLVRSLTDFCQRPLEVLTERAVMEGWHSERLFVYTLKVMDCEQPINRDGEVIDFRCLSFTEVLGCLRAGKFTPDAAIAIAASVLQSDLGTAHKFFQVSSDAIFA